MKKFLFICLTAIILGCFGTASAQTKKGSAKKKASTTATTKKGWTQPSSRDQFPSALSGTTWVSSDNKVKLEFSGNSVLRYYSKPRWNYDDPIEWYNPGPNAFDNPKTPLYFYIVQEPQKGLYEFQYRETPSGKGAIINLKVTGDKLYYKDGKSYIVMNKVK